MCGDGEWSFTFPDDCCSPATRWSECRPRAKGGTSRPNTAGPAGKNKRPALRVEVGRSLNHFASASPEAMS